MANHNPAKLYDDIRTRDNTNLPSPDLYVAGFPCQPFSKAGLRNDFSDENNGLIFFKIAEYVNTALPKAFLLENVANI